MRYFELRVKKQRLGFIYVAIFVFIIDSIYSLFSHGVGSWAMSTMVISVGVLGIIGYGLMGARHHAMLTNRQVDWFIRLYNTGIATLVVGQFLKGVMEIAGTGSPYVHFFFFGAGILFIISLVIFKRGRWR